MNEKMITKEVTVILDDNNDIIVPEETVGSKISKANKGKKKTKAESEKIALARSLYITTDLSIPAVAKQVGIEEGTLYKYSAEGKWSLLKVNPEQSEWGLQVVDTIYEAIDFYEKAKELLGKMLESKEFFNPKDIKLVIEGYRIAEDRTMALRLIKENGNRDNGTDY